MLRNVEYVSKPELYVYERNRGMACITLADNIREGVNENGEDCWYADLYMMELPDTDNMAERLEQHYQAFLARAKAIEAEQNKPPVKPELTTMEISRLEYDLLEMTYNTITYHITEDDGSITTMKGVY